MCFVVVTRDTHNHQRACNPGEDFDLLDEQAAVEPHLFSGSKGGAPRVGAALGHESFDAVSEVDQVDG